MGKSTVCNDYVFCFVVVIEREGFVGHGRVEGSVVWGICGWSGIVFMFMFVRLLSPVL